MNTIPGSYSHLANAMEGTCYVYVQGITPSDVIARLGARAEKFTSMTQSDVFNTSFASPSTSHRFIAATAIGDWTLLVDPGGSLGMAEEVIMPLSAGTRLVSHFFLSIKAIDYFFWIENSELRFCFIAQEGYAPDVPDELADTMAVVDSVYPDADPHEGPMFILAEELTGITMTPQLLEESTYLCGAVPSPHSEELPSP
ncbi:DUF6461 domain-containing protein [Nonomuraea sp. NPDC005692]|uniref:DUF6461 domain-containing protein n=1 Tax=Nonomuraea sp. NPDC005692 TaxID=3157168 RepID=UPI0033E5FE5C